MKKIHYLLAFVVAVATLSACKPLSKTYDTLGDLPAPKIAVVLPPTVASITLAPADYTFLPATNVASTQGFFHGNTDAFASIPAILAKKYPSVGDKSTVTVTYATSPFVPAITLADKTNANVSITLTAGLTPSDYKFTAFTYTPAVGTNISVSAVTFEDLSAAQALSWLRNRYKTVATTTPSLTYKPTLPDNSIVVLTYLYFESGVTASTGTLTTDAFLYTTANDWQKIYRVNNAQYTSVNRGTNTIFLAADVPNLPSYLSTFLKNDAAVMLTAKVGDVQYVNYKLGTSATAFTQEVMPLVYDGINWVNLNTTATTTFVYSLANNTWTGQLDNTVSYTLTTANYAAIVTYNQGLPAGTGPSTTALANLQLRGNFSIEAGSSGVTSPTDDGQRWTDVQIANSIISVLKTQFASPIVNQKFLVTASVFGGYTTQVFGFVYDGTNFVYKPVIDPAKYTITGDDYATIARAGIGTAAASLNLQQFGDFASSWTADQIAAGINTVLKLRFSTANGNAPTTNQVVKVTYSIFSGSATLVTKDYKYDGTNWIAQ